MTNAYWLDLARRAVACGHWRWVRGARRHDGYRYIGAGVWVRWSTAAVVTALHAPEQYPDLSDPATLGCLLTLVREAYGRPDAYIAYQEAPEQRGWALVRAGRVLAVESTEAEALVAALEAAPAAGGAR